VRQSDLSKAFQYRLRSKEATATFLQLLTFSWLNDLIHLGLVKSLSDDDLWDLCDKDKATKIYSDYQQINGHGGSLFRRLARYLRRFLVLGALYALVGTLLSFSGPYFLRQLLLYIEDSENSTPEYMALIYAGGLFIGSVLKSLCEGQYFYLGRRMGLLCRAIVVGELFSKSLKRKSCTAQIKKQPGARSVGEGSTVGQITNLMSVDSQKIVEAGKSGLPRGRTTVFSLQFDH
jgi:hypothetical protein